MRGEERRREAALRAARYQQALQQYHCRNIRPRTLEVGDLVLRRVLSREGLHKLSPMWEGPFKVVHVSRPGSARLETQEGVPVQNAWNPAPPEVLPLKRPRACEARRVPVKLSRFGKGPEPVKQGE